MNRWEAFESPQQPKSFQKNPGGAGRNHQPAVGVVFRRDARDDLLDVPFLESFERAHDQMGAKQALTTPA